MVYACGGIATLALGLMLPILIAADYVAVVSWWRTWRIRTVAVLLPGVLVGTAMAWGTVHLVQRFGGDGGQALSEAYLKIGIGGIALAFVALQLVRLFAGRPITFRPVLWQASMAGTVAGFTSTLGHAAGPVAAMYLLPQRMPKGRFVATTALLFWCINQIKVPFYLQLGWINSTSLWAGTLLLPAIVVGAALGIFLHRRVGARQFTGIVYTLLAIAGGHLIYKGIASLAA
jgi:uncharacterized membrane protein YfcA